MRLASVILLSLFVPAFVCCEKPAPVPVRPVQPVQPTKPDKDPINPLAEIKVMSFNVRGCRISEADPFNSWGKRCGACLEMLQVKRADIIGLQEADYEGQWSYFLEELAPDYDGCGVGCTDGKKSGAVNGFLYDNLFLKVLSSGTFWQSDTPGSPSECYNDGYKRSATWAIIQVKGTDSKFFFINTHMALKSEAQQKGLSVMLAKMGELNPLGYPMILTGDFNMVPSDSNLKPLRAIMMDARDAAPSSLTDSHKTYNAWGDSGRATVCDYIWITPEISCTQYFTDRSSYAGHTYISDHYPVNARIKLNN